MPNNAWKKVYLIVPPTGKYIREERCQTPVKKLHTVALRPPMDLLYMAASLEQDGVECLIKDYPAHDLTWDHFREDLRTFKPDAVLLSITTPTLVDDMNGARIAKEINPEIVTVTKGAHFIQLDQQSIAEYPSLDVIMRGEYEETIRELAQGKDYADINGITYRLNGEPQKNPDRGLIQDIDMIPNPARHLIDNRPYFRQDTGELQATIVTSRGCPFPCVFCLAQAVSGSKVRVRTPENVVAEIKDCVENHGIKSFLFRSDLFTANRKWVIELCKLIQAEGLDINWSCNSRVDTLRDDMLIEMKKAGCWLISFGVESGDPDMLEKMKKMVDFEKIQPAIDQCRKVGVKSSVYLLIGLPWESRETFNRTKKFATQLNPDFIEYFYSYPFYGTEFYDIAVKEGLLKEGELPKTSYNGPAIPTKYLSLEELAGLRAEALRAFYLRPGYILKTLSKTRSPKQLKNYFVYGLRQLRDLVVPS